jgi:hypothetical protein
MIIRTTDDFPIESLIVYDDQSYVKERLGRMHDGGYIILSNEHIKYDAFISCGIAGDDSFESDFLKDKNMPAFAFDGTVNSLVTNDTKQKMVFEKKNISGTNTDETTNLHDLITPYKNIFLKMDIEGGEYPWIQSLSIEQLNKFSQIVIEIHDPKKESQYEVLKKLASTHYLCHFHGNNTKKKEFLSNGIRIPVIFECTYILKSLASENIQFNKIPFPHPLDRRNNTKFDELTYENYPFVTY